VKEMLKVRDLMSRGVLTVAGEDSATDAARGFAIAGLSGAPVRDRSGALVGIVSQADLANVKLAGTRKHPTVSDLMTPDVIGVYADDSALAAALEMSRHDIHRVVVWDADGSVVGVVSTLDVVRAIARGAVFDVEAPDVAATPPRTSVIPRRRTGYR
jgi:CBS domain-containing protein